MNLVLLTDGGEADMVTVEDCVFGSPQNSYIET